MIFPIQPIKDGRFVENRIVSFLLDKGPFDLNDIAIMDFTNEEREQFAQLIGYSVSGFSSLNYVSDDTYSAIEVMQQGESEDKARIRSMQSTLDAIRKHLRDATCEAFAVHPDDLSGYPY